MSGRTLAMLNGSAASERDHRWQADANCAGIDPDMFFPNPKQDQSDAKEVCEGCPVRSECLEYALEHQIEHGIWGGTSERERRRLRRLRALARRAASA